MEFIAELARLPEMLKYVKEETKKNQVLPSVSHKLELATEEILVNIINYAYPDQRGKIWIETNSDSHSFEIHIKDQGIPFNPLEYKSDIGHNLPISERKIGGLGIYLVRQLMDKVAYHRENNMNHLTLFIKIPL